jgi:hypothetical protein
MTATTADTAARRIEAEVGPTGEVAIRTAGTEVRIRAVEGAVARVGLAGAPLAERFEVERAPGRLEVRPMRQGLLDLRTDAGPLEVEVPPYVALRVESASGSIRVLDVLSGGRYRTASGDIELIGIAGPLDAETVSGDLRIRAAGPTSLAVRTVSGDVDALGSTIERVDCHSTSGDVRIVGRMAGPGPYRFESVSGDVSVAPGGPVALSTMTLSGDVTSDLEGVVAGGRGRRLFTIGIGGPTIEARTLSGDVRLLSDTTSEPAKAVLPDADLLDIELPDAELDAEFAVAEAELADAEVELAHAEAELAAELEAAEVTGAPAAPEPPAPPAPPEPSDPGRPGDDDQRLAILRALEAGDIDVAEAERRLSDVEG